MHQETIAISMAHVFCYCYLHNPPPSLRSPLAINWQSGEAGPSIPT
jgi:hypothetical protein